MKRRVLIGLLIGVVPLLAFILYVVLSRQVPPVNEVDEARMNLALAEKASLPPGSEKVYLNACLYYDSAMSSWKSENLKFFLNRHFSKVTDYAVRSSQLALESIESAVNEKQKIIEQLEEGISQLNLLIQKYSFIYSAVPMEEKQQKDYTIGKIAFQEAKFAFKGGNIQRAQEKLNDANVIINRCLDNSHKIFNVYFDNYPQWKMWAKRSIENSKTANTSCIIIDKFARTCQLYKKGRMVSQYPAEFGQNWMGDKNFRGDKSTPEGIYKITRQKKNGETKYYKALLLNYPNDDDKKRFAESINNGIIRANAQIGSLIEIHGHGGLGIDWTDGCIALSDNDMDKIFAACSIGTIVTIIGSLRPLEEILQ